MNEIRYKTPTALEKAVKAAAQKSDQDTNQAIENYYHDRFLERVFSEPEPLFVLKGGRGMLARTVNARHTRDTDFLYKGFDLDEAVSDLKRLAAIDLGDFLEFRFDSVDEIAKDQEYRDGYRVVFIPVLGGTKFMNPISIDLVVSHLASAEADMVTPVSRLHVQDLPVYDYYVYPVASAIADKVCATMQKFSDGMESSRVRDLVDLVVYLTTESFESAKLSEQITLEMRLRRIDSTDSFHVPDAWRTLYFRAYEKSAAEARLPEEYRDVATAETLVKLCIDGVLSGEVVGRLWSSEELCWI